MKPIIPFFLLCLGLSATWLPGQTLHLILLCDTRNSKAAFAQTCQADYDHLRKEADTMARSIQYDLHVHALIGPDFTAKKLDETIAGLRADAADVILFYYSGAAFCNKDEAYKDENRWLRLENESVSFGARAANIKRKGARLNIFLIDGCGLNLSLSDSIGGSRSITQNIYRQLLQASGSVTAFSSSCSEYSLTDRRGSFFTNSMLQAFRYYGSIGYGSLNWQHILQMILTTVILLTLLILWQAGCELMITEAW